MSGRIRLALAGGGVDAFIGGVHRMAAAIDGRFELVAGMLSRDAERCERSAHAYGIALARAHSSLEAMLEAETARDAADRVELVSIVTPNHTHHAMAMACLNAGFGVLIEKPMTMTSQEGLEIESLASERRLPCAVMYNYTGYPMVREARARVLAGELGSVRRVFVEYHQGWLSERVEGEVPQATWRVDPERAGLGGALGDIGSHAENITRFVTGLEIESLCAELTSFVDGRELDDDAAVMLRFIGGAKGTLTASQICAGEGNGLTLRVYGDRGGLRWRQQAPEHLELLDLDNTVRTLTRGQASLGDDAASLSRIPLGHPEGFIEAFANVYRGVAEQVEAWREGRDPAAARGLTPGPAEGRAGVEFVERCVASARDGGAWVSLKG